MNVECSENAIMPCNIDLLLHENGDISMGFPFEFLDLGEEYYEQNGQNIFYSNVFQLLNECATYAKTKGDKMVLLNTVKNLINSCEKIKKELEG